MGGKMARNKGQRGEREAIALLQQVVDEVCEKKQVERVVLKRNLMQTMEGGCDVAGLEWMSLEVKRVENQSGLNGWWAQALRQANFGKPNEKTAVLMYRPNNSQWKVRMRVPIAVERNMRGPKMIRATVTVDIQTFLVYFRERLKVELV